MLNSMSQRKSKEKQAFVFPQKYLPIAKYLLSNSCQKNSKFTIENPGQEHFDQKSMLAYCCYGLYTDCVPQKLMC